MKKGVFLLLLIISVPIIAAQLSKPMISMEIETQKKQVEKNPTYTPIAINGRILERLPLKINKPLELTFSIKFRPISSTFGGQISPIVPNTRITPIGGYAVPVNITVVKLPYEARNIEVEVEPIYERPINSIPAMYPLAPAIAFHESLLELGPNIEPPNLPLYEYEIHRGIDPETLEKSTYLIIRIYPLRILGTGTISIASEVRVGIRFLLKKRGDLDAQQEQIDVLIITSKQLAVAAEKLQNLKQMQGLRTRIIFVEDIYSSYAGRDLPEKIRNCISSFVKSSGVKFVVILGDTDVVPAREVYVPDGAFDDDPEIDGKFVETDLYYADLQYSWDDNNDGLWGDLRYDRVDGVPDVIVGRIPVSNITEALGVVEKIEKYKPILPLYGSVLFAGTDTFQIGYPEGEYLLEFSEKFIENMTIVKLYETFGNLTRSNFVVEFDKGHYLIAFTGHGLPDRVALTFSQTYTMGDAYAQRNWVYPIFIALSCDAGRFKDIDSLSEALVVNPEGGAIAFIGSTRIAWGYIGELVTTGLIGEMFWRTIKNIYNRTFGENLGRVWAQTVTEYVVNHPIRNKLAGYYLDWKTVAEYNLLGDPTLFIRPTKIGNITQDDMEVNNGARMIMNETLIVNKLSCSNASLHIENSIVILNGSANIDGSDITLNNSILVGNIDINASNANITAINSLIVPELVLSNSSLEALNTVISRITVDQMGYLNITSSTLNMEIIGVSGTLIGIRDGFIGYLNLTDLGLEGEISNSTLSLSLVAMGTSLELNNVTLGELDTYESNVVIENSTISKVRVESSNITAKLSNMSFSIVISSSSQIVGLVPEEYTETMIFGKSKLQLQEVYVRSWSIIMHGTSVEIIDSKISSLTLSDSEIIGTNLNASFINAKNSTVTLSNASGMLLNLNGGSECFISYSRVMNLELSGNSSCDVNTSKIIVIHLENSSSYINSSRVESVFAIGISRMSVLNSVVVEAKIKENSTLTMDKCRAAVVDAEDHSHLEINCSEILYWLRIYDQAEATTRNSIIWFGLVYEKEVASIEGLESGIVSHLIISKDDGWRIELIDTEVLAWDILAYSSNITVRSSQLGWIILFYGSKLTMQYSQAMLLRITHNSTAIIEHASLSAVYASGSSRTQASESTLGMVYLLGEAQVYLHRVVFDIVAGLAESAYAEIVSSYGGLVAGISGTRIVMSDSMATIYVSIVEENANIHGLKPQYIETWNSDALGIDEDWSISITDSHVSWAIDVSLGKFDIEDCLLAQLFVSNATVTIRNVIVSDLMGIYDSNVEIDSSKLSSITLIWSSNVIMRGTISLYAYIIESNITMIDSVANIVLGFLEGQYELRLRPGFYENASLDEFMNSSPPIKLRLIDTSVTGWYAIGLGISGHVGLKIVDSEIISVGIAYGGTLIVENSKVYGYSQIYIQKGMNVSMLIKNSVTRLYLTMYNIKESINITNLRDLTPVTAQITSFVNIINSTITEVSIETRDVDIYAENSNISTLRSTASNVTISGCEVEKLYSAGTNISVVSSKIKAAWILSSEASIMGSKIGSLVLYGASFRIRDSEIGLSLYLSFMNLVASQLQPLYISEANVPQDLPLLANGTIENTQITRWNILVGEFSTVKIDNSVIGKVDVSSHISTVYIEDSVVGSLHMGYGGNINVSQSQVGIDMDIVNLGLTIKNLRQGTINRLTAENIAGSEAPWEINISSSRITMLNVTVHGSDVVLRNLNASIMIVNASSAITIEDTYSLSLIIGGPSNVEIASSFVRLINPGYGTELDIYNSTAGIIETYLYGSINLQNLSSVPQTYHSPQMGFSLMAMNSRLVDWAILSMMFANTTIMNSHIFAVGTDGFARAYLIDTLFEYPIDAMDLSEIHILYTLTIEVVYDFGTPKTARIEIIGAKTLDLEAQNGKISVVLYQGIVKEYEKIDMGDYTIKAYVGSRSASKRIYLWKPMKIRIIIYGPMSIAIFAAIVAALFFVAMKLIERRRVKRAEELSETTMLTQ